MGHLLWNSRGAWAMRHNHRGNGDANALAPIRRKYKVRLRLLMCCRREISSCGRVISTVLSRRESPGVRPARGAATHVGRAPEARTCAQVLHGYTVRAPAAAANSRKSIGGAGTAFVWRARQISFNSKSRCPQPVVRTSARRRTDAGV